MKGLPKDTYKLDYALVYFSDLEAITKIMLQSTKARSMGLYVGSLTGQELKNLNLKRSEQGATDVVLFSRILEYIYVTNKLRMLEPCISYIDNFMRLLHTKYQGSFEIDLTSRIRLYQPLLRDCLCWCSRMNSS